MNVLVVDASVVVKWLLPDRNEEDTPIALQILDGIRSAEIDMMQPVHWLIEAIAVVARISPHTAERQAVALHALEIPVMDSPAVLQRACRLAHQLEHHLFDALYHAVALETDAALFVTADERYYSRARSQGRIMLLRDFRSP